MKLSPLLAFTPLPLAFAPLLHSGDVTADTLTNTQDIAAMQQYLLTGASLPAPESGDLNGDGVLDIYDLALLKRVTLGTTEAISPAVEKALASMTIEEKVGQLFIVTPEALAGTSSAVTQSGSATKAGLQKRPVGGIIYFAQNLKSASQTKTMIANARQYAVDAHGIGLFIAVDEEGGRVARVAKSLGTTAYSPMSVYGAAGDPEKVRAIGEDIAEDIAQFGFNLDFAPVADVNIDPANELGDRIFSKDPAVVAEMVGAMTTGLQSSGKVSATLKHFPGLGAANKNTHNDLRAPISRSLEQLQATEFVAFRGGIEAGADFVMVGHQIMSCTESDLPSDLSPVVVTDWLRGELGFTGIVVTDAQNMKTISGRYTPGQAAVLAIQAGVDVVLMPANFDSAYAEVCKAVQTGEISEERVDESVVRILTVKERRGVL